MSRRSEKVAEEIREEIALLIGSALKDPRIGFVTVMKRGLLELEGALAQRLMPVRARGSIGSRARAR